MNFKPESAPPIVEATEIAKNFKERNLWSGLTFGVRSGEMMAVRGQSGSGKTTLLNCVGALESVDSGDLIVAGTNLGHMKGGQRRRFFRESVGFLFQNYALIESWTVERNLQVPLEHSHQNKETKRRKMLQVLDRVGLGDILGKAVYSLSGGEQQRVALARLLLKDAHVILADEPTSALDDHNAGLLIELLLEKCETGAAVMISTHDPRLLVACHTELRLTDSSLEDTTARPVHAL